MWISWVSLQRIEAEAQSRYSLHVVEKTKEEQISIASFLSEPPLSISDVPALLPPLTPLKGSYHRYRKEDNNSQPAQTYPNIPKPPSAPTPAAISSRLIELTSSDVAWAWACVVESAADANETKEERRRTRGKVRRREKQGRGLGRDRRRRRREGDCARWGERVREGYIVGDVQRKGR
jgi:hypothetical protein